MSIQIGTSSYRKARVFHIMQQEWRSRVFFCSILFLRRSKMRNKSDLCVRLSSHLEVDRQFCRLLKFIQRFIAKSKSKSSHSYLLKMETKPAHFTSFHSIWNQHCLLLFAINAELYQIKLSLKIIRRGNLEIKLI